MNKNQVYLQCTDAQPHPRTCEVDIVLSDMSFIEAESFGLMILCFSHFSLGKSKSAAQYRRIFSID
jgi:hypothetical protein